jgi:hypothetical protein
MCAAEDARARNCGSIVLTAGGEQDSQSMMTFSDLASVPCDPLAPFTDQLRLAVAAYPARFKGSSREHTESDLRCYLAWCAERGLDPLAAQRPHLELYIRPMQETRRFKPPPSPGWTGTRPPAACGTSPEPPASDRQGAPAHAPPQVCLPVSTLALTCAMCGSPPGTPIRAPRCGFVRV